ncbi:YebC/PmpR family DNA-binding transcriptional regulator [Candidatus Bandiella euplotis]|uniref:Probable transcriptional regulatory protein Bandiella_00372 n=1 Tax=Candidatus Bandiella euplotis TaxID=1664265 RepID=A0ABZ0UJI4_9RICK|nr:YebC/PmpR family DNA-binding transcriptional regulator [Candidatus Bandiella woodruffii]WPX96263.1 YebC/PmpR family DNA-binding transcriptional regulator [Candidatus Bandiella woodruffii]
MAGHSKFKNIMHRKGAQDNRRAKAFTRVVKEIIVAVKSGMPDPNFNPRLRAAITAAKQVNLPKDKIDSAIKKAISGNDGVDYEEVKYEGYAPGGVALIVEALTDNRNRTASEVRAAFSKFGGALGEQGSVGYLFRRVGLIVYDDSGDIDKDNLIEYALELEVEDCLEEEGCMEILCSVEKYPEISEKLEQKFGKPIESEIKWVADLMVDLDEDKSVKILKLVEALDNLDDVQSVSGNYRLAESA